MTRREAVIQYPGHQSPGNRTVVYVAELVGSWWPGLSHVCECGGTRWVDLPDIEAGRVYCSLCSRDVADVLTRRRPPLLAETEPPKRGRPRKELV